MLTLGKSICIKCMHVTFYRQVSHAILGLFGALEILPTFYLIKYLKKLKKNELLGGKQFTCKTFGPHRVVLFENQSISQKPLLVERN